MRNGKEGLREGDRAWKEKEDWVMLEVYSIGI